MKHHTSSTRCACHARAAWHLVYSIFVYFPTDAPTRHAIQYACSGADLGTETVLRVTEAEQEFVFEGIEAQPVPSLLRGLSAPVHISVEGQTDEDLLLLLANDTGERGC